MNLKQMVMAGSCALTLFAGSNLMAWGGSSYTVGGTTYYNFGGRTGSSYNVGGTTYYNFGGRTGSSYNVGGTTYYSGNLFRGQITKKLFANVEIAKKIDAVAIQDALATRNTEALASCAWDLKGLEIVLGKKDTKTTSDMLFNAAAEFSVEQGNIEALKQIIALAPECKKYEAQLAMKAKTRGISKSVCALPQLCLLPPKDYKKAIESLKTWQQPVMDVYICSSFRGMSTNKAESVSMMINRGRVEMNPQMIAMGALGLSEHQYDKKLGAKFEPANIFAEAAELAIYKRDKNALNQISALYDTASFRDNNFANYLKNNQMMMSNLRGQEEDAIATAGKAALGTFIIVLTKCLFF